MDDGVFMLKARKCKRCGGILTSEQAIKDGYGHICKMRERADIEAAKPDPDQITFKQLFNNKEENSNGNSD